MWTTRYYVRPVSDLCDEIEHYIATYGITNVDFQDLTAFINREWILEFCQEIERRSIRITYQVPSGTRSEVLDREVLGALFRTGCRNITYAPESGSLEILEKMKKRIHLEHVVASAEAAMSLGMLTRAHLIIGYPGERRRDILDTLRFGIELSLRGVDYIIIFPFIAYPGSEIYEHLRAAGKLPELSNDYFATLDLKGLAGRTSFCDVSGAELDVARFAGMATFAAISLLRHPAKIPRIFRNVPKGISESDLEQFLVEALRRLRTKVLPDPGRSARTGGPGAKEDRTPWSLKTVRSQVGRMVREGMQLNAAVVSNVRYRKGGSNGSYSAGESQVQ
jgi:hypothetical protein